MTATTPAVADEQARDSGTPPAAVSVEPQPPAPVRAWTLDLNLGSGTPYGFISLSRDFHLSSWAGVRAIAGVGGGPQLSFMPFVRRELPGGVELELAAGVSGGPRIWREGPYCFSGDCATKRSSFTGSANLEVSVKWERDSGWHARPYVGVTRVLNPGSLECSGSDRAIAHCRDAHDDDGEPGVYGGISLGRSW